MTRRPEPRGEIPAPPPSSALRALVHDAPKVTPREPLRALVLACVACGLALALGVQARGVRADRAHLPDAWFWSVTAVWTVAFVGALASVLVPPRGSVFPDEKRLRIAAIGVPVLSVTLGLVAILATPHTLVPRDVAGDVERALTCGAWGLASISAASVATLVGLRRAAMPEELRWIGASVGAAGGAFAGLAIHLQCPWDGTAHRTLVHAGITLMAVALGAIAIPRLLDRP